MGRSMQPPEPGPLLAGDGEEAYDRTVDVGVIVAHSPGVDRERLRSFAARMAADAVSELVSATDVAWRFHAEEPSRLSDADARRPSAFLDQATDRMVEGPYDLTIVVTDVPLQSSRKRFVPGLASPLSRVAVVSTARLVTGPREERHRSLDAESVRWNAATLLLHLVGHLLGARHADATDPGSAMAPFRFDPERREVASFDSNVVRYLDRIAADATETETTARGPLGRVVFYARSVTGNVRQVLAAVVKSRAVLLPLSLPKLTTAAVTPTLVIVFSAEAWDVGFHMSDATAALFAVVSIVAAALYLLFVQNLSFPRKHHRVLTEHTAVVNVSIFLMLLATMVGLFVLVASTMLLIEFVVFPPNLMANWPSLEDPTVTIHDLVRTAGFISTIGVLSGALAGGLESRTIVRHLTLFRDRP